MKIKHNSLGLKPDRVKSDKSRRNVVDEQRENTIRRDKTPDTNNKMKTIIVDGCEFETTTHHLNKTLSEIEIPKGWRLLKPSEAMMLWEIEHFVSWFFVEQTIKKNIGKYVARFSADSDWAILNCCRDPTDRNAGLGVRFCRDIKKRVKK